MPERPPIRATGRITRVHRPDHVFEVEMANGYRAYAVLERGGPRPPRLSCRTDGADSADGEVVDPVGQEVVVHYSPFDMSHCKIAEWRG